MPERLDFSVCAKCDGLKVRVGPRQKWRCRACHNKKANVANLRKKTANGKRFNVDGGTNLTLEAKIEALREEHSDRWAEVRLEKIRATGMILHDPCAIEQRRCKQMAIKEREEIRCQRQRRA